MIKWTIALLVSLVFLIAVLVSQSPYLRPKEVAQPISFNHVKHKGMRCAICHRGLDSRRPRAQAGLASLQLCTKCHAQPPLKDPKEIEQWESFKETDDVPWRPLAQVADHVYFSHARHVTLGKQECATCHGDMSTLEAPPTRPLVTQTMTWCLDCHKEKKVATDCTRCHR